MSHFVTFQQLDKLWQRAWHFWRRNSGSHSYSFWAGSSFCRIWKTFADYSAQACLDRVKKSQQKISAARLTPRVIMVTWRPAVRQMWMGITWAENILLFHHVTTIQGINYLTVSLQRKHAHAQLCVLLIDWQVWVVTMGTRMEVAQLESRLNSDDYKKLQSIFLVSVGLNLTLHFS